MGGLLAIFEDFMDDVLVICDLSLLEGVTGVTLLD